MSDAMLALPVKELTLVVKCRLAVLVTKHAVLSAPRQGAGGAAVWTHREFLPQAWHVRFCAHLFTWQGSLRSPSASLYRIA